MTGIDRGIPTFQEVFMSQDVVVFSFESINVRTLTIEGEVFFCAADIGQALGVSARAILKRIPPKDVTQSDTLTSGGAPLARSLLRESAPRIPLRT